MANSVPWLEAALTAAANRVSFADRFKPRGIVQRVGDGVALVAGLDDVRFEEMLTFDSGAYGMAYDLRADAVGAILLGGGIKRRQMFFTRFGEQLADVINPVPSFLAATRAETFDRLENRLGLVAGKIVIDIDDQQRRALTETGFLAKPGERKDLFIA